MKLTIKNNLFRCVLLVAALAAFASGRAENRIYIEPLSIDGYGQTMLDVYLDNSNELQTLQFDIKLPAELEFVGKTLLKNMDRVPNGMEFMFNPSNGRVVLMPLNPGLRVLGNEGLLVQVPVKVKAGCLANRTVSVALENAIGATSGVQHDMAPSQVSVTLTDLNAPRNHAYTSTDKILLNAGTVGDLDLSVFNNYEIRGFQVNIILPAGVSFTQNDLVLADRFPMGSYVSVTPRAGNVYNLAWVSMTGQYITEGDGPLLTVRLHAAADFAAEQSTIAVDNFIGTYQYGTDWNQTQSIKGAGFNAAVVNCAPALARANQTVADLRAALRAALDEIATKYPDVKDNFAGTAISAKIDAIAAAVQQAYEDGSLIDAYTGVVTDPAIEVKGDISALLAAAREAHDKFNAEAARQAANKAAYDKTVAQLDALQTLLDRTNKDVADNYPDANVATEQASAAEAIASARQLAAVALKAVEKAGEYNYTVPSQEITAAINAITAAAKRQYDEKEAARQAANKAAYDRTVAQLDALQKQLDDMNAKVAGEYPGTDTSAEGAAAAQAISDARAAAKTAFDAVTTAGTYDYTVPTADIEAAIAAIEAAARQQAADAEAARQAANKAAYDKVMADIQSLHDALAAAETSIKDKYPLIDMTAEYAAVNAMIDAVEADARRAYEAVAGAGTFDFTVDAQKVLGEIAALTPAAEQKEADRIEAERRAANEGAYQQTLDKIAILQAKLDEMKQIISVVYPEVDMTEHYTAVQQMIDDARRGADDAIAAVEEAGVYDYTFDAKEIEEAISKLKELAKSDGFDNIGAETDNEPVYYSLQGVRITNPASGQVVVKIANDGARKKIVVN